MKRHKKRPRNRNAFVGAFYRNPAIQYATTVVSAIALAGFIFSGILLFRYADTADLISQGQRQMSEGKVALAARTFQILVNRHPESYEGHLLLGKAYLELDERRKAEQEFKIASSLKTRGRGITGEGAEIAMSKLAIAQKDFNKAEDLLIKAYKKSPRDEELQEALFELYETWGDTLSEEPNKDYNEIIKKYEKSLRYVDEYRLEEMVKEKLMGIIAVYTDELRVQKDHKKIIRLLSKSLKYQYLPDSMIQIAESYEKLNQLDDAIDWYRKAFDANPSVVSIRLTDVLVKRGRQLLDEKKPEEAQKYFDEADQISKLANIPLDTLYPVKATEVHMASVIDGETGEFEPKVNVKFVNEADRPLNFLLAKAVFLSGDEEVAVITETVATPEEPLGVKGSKAATRTLTLKPENKLNIHQLKKPQLQVRISVAYSEGPNQAWKVKALQEAAIKRPEPTSATSNPEVEED